MASNKVVLSRLKDENGGKVYQGSELHRFTVTTAKSCADQALSDLISLDSKMRARLEWSDISLMRSILLFLSWQDNFEEATGSESRLSEIKSALVSIAEVFHAPFYPKFYFG